MALPQTSFWFRPGRLIKNGRKYPGILAVDERYEFVAHEVTKDCSRWTYCCKYKKTPKVKCPARAKMALFDGKWILQHFDFSFIIFVKSKKHNLMVSTFTISRFFLDSIAYR